MAKLSYIEDANRNAGDIMWRVYRVNADGTRGHCIGRIRQLVRTGDWQAVGQCSERARKGRYYGTRNGAGQWLNRQWCAAFRKLHGVDPS